MSQSESISTALQRLIFVCPEYADVWRGRRANDVADGIPPPEEFVETAELASWVVERVADEDHSCLAELFSEVEELLSAGSPEVRELMTIGLLEDIQLGLGEARASLHDADVLLQFFGPATREAWFKVRSWWNRPQAEP